MGTGGTEARLRAHVAALGGTIGERHLSRPAALAAAADYVAEQWRAQGYRPEREAFAVEGVACANLVVTRPGRGRAGDGMVLVGAHAGDVPDILDYPRFAMAVAGLTGCLARLAGE